jgi:protein involved in polysaccharide export with SLBB domain
MQSICKLGAMAFALALAACNGNEAPGTGVSLQMPLVHAAQSSGTPVSGTATQRFSGVYTLGPSDLIRVKVYNEPDLTGEYQVDGAGFISIPLAGRIKAAGLTTAQLEQSLTKRLNEGILHDARVNIEVSSYAPYYIQGEVKRGGEFPYRPGLTIRDAIASAGGFTYRANEREVYIRPVGTAVEEVYPVDARVPIRPGDSIRVAERYF